MEGMSLSPRRRDRSLSLSSKPKAGAVKSRSSARVTNREVAQGDTTVQEMPAADVSRRAGWRSLRSTGCTGRPS